MNIVLRKFRVQNFRSIEDSGWIDAENVTCLVGTNESGKTNLLLALWKLKPANGEPIDPLVDYPRKKYHTFSSTQGSEIFVTAQFDVDEDTAKGLEETTGWPHSIFREIAVGRKYNGAYVIQLPHNKLEKLAGSYAAGELGKVLIALEGTLFPEGEEQNQFNSIRSQVETAKNSIATLEVDLQKLIDIRKGIEKLLDSAADNVKTHVSGIVMSSLDKMLAAVSANGITLTADSENQVLGKLPTFVYYSDYGNLDSEIYLPHVIENFRRSDLGERERAKARSLKVLFEFVKLRPDQILELGKEALPVKVIEYVQYQHNNQRNKTGEHIEEATQVDIEAQNKNKKERGILLQAASTSLTKDFAAWWKQGKYVFDFQADGNHFRIWVSDDKRPERIELEGRSKGLQWFFSFFLVFLVESKDSHSNCILLLDEPGISLHPVAQMDLIAFFDSLSKENQLLYTTHSPFLVNPNNLSGAHAMYVGDHGESVVSSDLRANVKIAEKSIYPIHAAIGITVSDTLLIGCQPVLVEGVSDQIYLQQVKKYVLGQGKYKNSREVVFIPTGGVKGMSPVIKILMGKDDKLPFVIMDSDKAGKDKIKQLENGLYKDEKEKVLSLAGFIGEGEYEIEDLMPSKELAKLFSKQYRRVHTEDEFDDIHDSSKPIIDQMETFAKNNGYQLPEGWKVDLAKEFQRGFERIVTRCDDATKERWVKLIEKVTT